MTHSINLECVRMVGTRLEKVSASESWKEKKSKNGALVVSLSWRFKSGSYGYKH